MSDSIALAVKTTGDLLNKIVESPEEAAISADLLVKQENLSLPERVDAASLLLEKLKTEKAHFKETAAKFTKIVRALEMIEERIKSGIKTQMFERGETDLLGELTRFKLSEIEPRLEYEESEISDEYKIQVVQTKVNDSKIRSDLSQGKEVKGARLVSNFRLASYVNRKTKAASNE